MILLIGAVLVAVLPGLRQEGAEWKQALSFLRAAKAAPGVGAGRAAVPADFDLLVGLVPKLSVLSEKERAGVVKAAKIVDVPAGTAILRRGDAGDTAYFILSGRVAAGLTEEGGEYRSLETMLDGDLFGEIAALTGSTRRADVVATDASTLFQIPAEVLRTLMSKPALGAMVLSKMTERLSISSPDELPRFAGMDQKSLRDLRTAPEEEAVALGAPWFRRLRRSRKVRSSGPPEGRDNGPHPSASGYPPPASLSASRTSPQMEEHNLGRGSGGIRGRGKRRKGDMREERPHIPFSRTCARSGALWPN